jgi:hypothetical protein
MQRHNPIIILFFIDTSRFVGLAAILHYEAIVGSRIILPAKCSRLMSRPDIFSLAEKAGLKCRADLQIRQWQSAEVEVRAVQCGEGACQKQGSSIHHPPVTSHHSGYAGSYIWALM